MFTPLIFICSLRPDQASAQRVHTALSNAGLRPWSDTIDLVPGDRWDEAIPDALWQSAVVLVLVTYNWPGRDQQSVGWYGPEAIALAIERAQQSDNSSVIVPVLLDGVPADRLPYGLSRLVRIEATSDDLKPLLAGLKKVLDRRPEIPYEPAVSRQSKRISAGGGLTSPGGRTMNDATPVAKAALDAAIDGVSCAGVGAPATPNSGGEARSARSFHTGRSGLAFLLTMLVSPLLISLGAQEESPSGRTSGPEARDAELENQVGSFDVPATAGATSAPEPSYADGRLPSLRQHFHEKLQQCLCKQAHDLLEDVRSTQEEHVAATALAEALADDYDNRCNPTYGLCRTR